MPGYPIGNPSQNDHQICLDVETHRFLNVVGAMHFHKNKYRGAHSIACQTIYFIAICRQSKASILYRIR